MANIVRHLFNKYVLYSSYQIFQFIVYYCSSRRNLFLIGRLSKFSTTTQQNEAKHDLKLSDSCVKRLREICQDGSFLRVIVEVTKSNIQKW